MICDLCGLSLEVYAMRHDDGSVTIEQLCPHCNFDHEKPKPYVPGIVRATISGVEVPIVSASITSMVSSPTGWRFGWPKPTPSTALLMIDKSEFATIREYGPSSQFNIKYNDIDLGDFRITAVVDDPSKGRLALEMESIQ